MASLITEIFYLKFLKVPDRVFYGPLFKLYQPYWSPVAVLLDFAHVNRIKMYFKEMLILIFSMHLWNLNQNQKFLEMEILQLGLVYNGQSLYLWNIFLHFINFDMFSNKFLDIGFHSLKRWYKMTNTKLPLGWHFVLTKAQRSSLLQPSSLVPYALHSFLQLSSVATHPGWTQLGFPMSSHALK